jgi:hypothetical protein
MKTTLLLALLLIPAMALGQNASQTNATTFASGGVTSNVVPKSNGAGKLANSTLVDDGTGLYSTSGHLTIGFSGYDTTVGVEIDTTNTTGVAQAGLGIYNTCASDATTSCFAEESAAIGANAVYNTTTVGGLHVNHFTLGTGQTATHGVGILLDATTAGSSDTFEIKSIGTNPSSFAGPILSKYFYGTETAAPSGIAGSDVLYPDSTAHRWKMSNNNGTAAQVVASGVDVDTNDQVTATHLAAANADLRLGVPAITTSAMGAQSSATCTNVTNMTWNVAASKNYILSCEVPITFAASATVAFCLGGPGTATSFSLEADGPIGAAAAYAQISTLAQTAYGTKTGASGAPGAAEWVHVKATIQNGSTASGTALTLQTAGNGTNNITVGANASCTLVQTN